MFTSGLGDLQGDPVEERRLRSLEATLDALQHVLRMLQLAAGWAPHRVHLLGFSQVGMAPPCMLCPAPYHSLGL